MFDWPAVFHELVTPQHFLCLRCAEKVGCEFGASHVIENLPTLFQPFSDVNVPGRKSALQASVAVILKHGIVQAALHPDVLGRGGQMLVVQALFVPWQGQRNKIQGTLSVIDCTSPYSTRIFHHHLNIP